MAAWLNAVPAPRPRWAVWGFIVYAAAAVLVLVAPVSYGEIVATIGEWIRGPLGITWFGFGWIEFVANIVFFAPLGFLLTMIVRHPGWGAAAAIAMSVGAELVQVLVPGRLSSARDVIANGLGAAVGAAIAWWAGRRRHPDDTDRQGAPDVT